MNTKPLEIKLECELFRLLQSTLSCTKGCASCCLRCDQFYECFYGYTFFCRIDRLNWICIIAIGMMNTLNIKKKR